MVTPQNILADQDMGAGFGMILPPCSLRCGLPPALALPRSAVRGQGFVGC